MVLTCVSLTISGISSCSLFKDRRFLTHQESVKKFFQTSYQVMHIDKYNGRLDFEFGMNDTIIKLDSLNIRFSSSSTDYLELFKNRLIPSDILYTDSINIISICCFEHFDFLRTKKTARRFQLWKYDGKFINPTAYYFELTNKNANRETDLKTFIQGARLTFISWPLHQI